MLHAGVTFNGADKDIRLIFDREDGKWKLDAPESLHLAMGDNWEKKVDQAEQVYVLMLMQFGPQFNCASMLDLANKFKHKK